MEEDQVEVPTTTLPEAPKTPFTDHLEATGAIDLLADTLVTLYTNPKTYPEIFNLFLQTVGAHEHPDIEKILTENQDLRKRIITLKSQITDLEGKLRK